MSVHPDRRRAQRGLRRSRQLPRGGDGSRLPPGNLLSPTTISFSVANIALWGGTGFNTIVLFTGALLSILPLVVLFLTLQRYRRVDLLSGAVKG